MTHDPAPPAELGPAGLALWHELADSFDFEPHNLPILGEACRIRDRLDELDTVVRADGVTVQTPQGIKAHPALVESRQQQITMTRLVASLRLPDEDGTMPQRRGGARGSYARNRDRHLRGVR
jgi:hypothetical protein